MTTDGVVHLSRTFPADLEQVSAGADHPAELAAWFWPADYGTTAEADARVGGRYRIAAAGRQLAVEGEYLEVARPAGSSPAGAGTATTSAASSTST